MAQIRPFAGVRYSRRKNLDFSKVIAPPYDVLDEKDRGALQSQHPNNVVWVDLPWLPPKTVGPDEVYAEAAKTMQSWLTEGILQRDGRAALYPYMQTFAHGGRTYHRRGMIALVKLTPFGVDVIPHEKTFAAPIEDRLKLMRYTGMQLSPIFGLFNDSRNEVTNLMYRNIGRPEIAATMDGVRNDLWSVIDNEIEIQVIDAMKHRPVYIADGHHRYTTALQYQRECEAKAGGYLPPNHPANWCMFVLVSMQDDGLLILPTHRLIGGLEGFSIAALQAALRGVFEVRETAVGADGVESLAGDLAGQGPHAFAMYDGVLGRCYTLKLLQPDILEKLEPERNAAWRKLDVAILERYLIDAVLRPKFAGGRELAKGYTAMPGTIRQMVDGRKFQLALMLPPTPLRALEELGQAGEVMPQKSTYFFPKLATGMVMNPLR